MTELSADFTERRRQLYEIFSSVDDENVAAFSDFWRQNCVSARLKIQQFQRVMSGEDEISFQKVSELELQALKLSQYEFALGEKASAVLADGDLLVAVRQCLGEAEQYRIYARNSLKTIHGWLPSSMQTGR